MVRRLRRLWAGGHRAGLFVISYCLLAGGALAAEQAPAGAGSSARPNIVFAIADDWSWPHAGAYGDRAVQTPVFDRLAAEGALFANAFCASPSCTPSRGAILTGQAVHRLQEGGNLWSILQKRYMTYPDLLEANGYAVGYTGKAWGPGSLEGSGRDRNPAGPVFKSFDEFLKQAPPGKPFCFWFGSTDPHRPYEPETGLKSGLKPADVTVPGFYPDVPEVRSDLLDYYFEVQRFDRDVGTLLKTLDQTGQARNTLVIVTSDNGMPFPRCKANLYSAGTHMPLAMRWPGRIAGGRKVNEFVNLTDVAPTILQAAGIEAPADMTGRSLLPLTEGKPDAGRDAVFLERERHANVRSGDLSYPSRAIRTADFLYIRNLRPARWPAGDPEKWKSVGPFGDVDPSPTKDFLLAHQGESEIQPFFQLSFAKRPAEELYDLKRDPWEVTNVACEPGYAAAKEKLAARLTAWMRETADPRASSDADPWDTYPYFGERPAKKANRKK